MMVSRKARKESVRQEIRAQNTAYLLACGRKRNLPTRSNMVKLRVIEQGKPTDGTLDMLMKYAAVFDEGQKEILSSCLVRAMDMVQRTADTALLPGRWRIVASEHSGEIKVYMGGMVESVSGRHGDAIPFTQCGNKVFVSGDYAEVVFTTEADPAQYDVLLPVVLKYATALYDGSDAVTLNSILKEAM